MTAGTSPPVRPRRQPGRRRRWYAVGLLAGVVVFLIAVLATGAGAAPQQAPPPLPIPTNESCAPSSPLPECNLPKPTTTTPKPPTTPLPIPTEVPPPTTCTFPGQLSCASLGPTTTAPCSGEDCIPQPTPTPPASGTHSPGKGNNGNDSNCGLTDIGACITDAINSVFVEVVNSALSPILDLIGHSALSTPTISDLPGITDLWNNSWNIAVAAYGLFVLAAGIIVMSHETLQSRYSLKEIAPRIPVAFAASALSLFIVDKIIRLANGLTLGVLGGDVSPPSVGDTMSEAFHNAQSGGLFMILIAIALVVVGVALLVVYAVRVVITLVLIVAGPLFLMCHILPITDPLANWWWKATTAAVSIQVAQALVLITTVRTVLSSGVHLFGSTLSALGMLLAGIALFFVLFRIPFWFMSATKLGSGRSLLGSLIRAYVMAKTFGMVMGKTRTPQKAAIKTGTASRSSNPTPSSRPAPKPSTPGERLKTAYDAERQRAARRPRTPSQAPQFIQPSPQETTHDPAVTPRKQGTAKPKFSSVSAPATPPARPTQKPGAPEFRSAAVRPSSPAPPPSRPIRTAAVPPKLKFQPAATAPPQSPVPPKPTAAPAAPKFQQAQPESRIGDAYRRTPSVPPAVFRAPMPAPGGDQS
ncbi:hypothetical protein [Amycolatopsis sp. La24]|uniref:hypothetical protein n=1 Tax=Amycolatopsis sp. La24 TaxID=3028304 RepID=UPI0023B1FBDB|nr:hypothetical protein [Amycolatopsis sp. La24]